MTRYPEYIQRSIDRLKAFEPPEGYFVAFSGGKDSQCIYRKPTAPQRTRWLQRWVNNPQLFWSNETFEQYLRER